VVLGQSFTANEGVIDLSIGDYVFAGSISDGQLDILVPVGMDYLLGVSEVAVVGSISSVDSSIGQFSIGGTTVDFATLLSTAPEIDPQVGDWVEITGNQVAPDAPIVLGIHGSGARGIHGSGARGIHGSGAR
jgi:hypothetical protein